MTFVEKMKAAVMRSPEYVHGTRKYQYWINNDGLCRIKIADLGTLHCKIEKLELCPVRSAKYLEIVHNINSNGGLDMNYIRHCARLDGVTVEKYLIDYIKGLFGCHGNAARKAAEWFLY